MRPERTLGPLWVLVIAMCHAHAQAHAAEAARLPAFRCMKGAESLRPRTEAQWVQAAEQLEERTGLRAPSHVTVILCSGRRQFESVVPGAPKWAMAIARPAADEIVIDGVPFTQPGNNARATLTHELLHLALGEAARGKPDLFPLWFNEGLACWAADAPHPGDYERVDLAAAFKTLPRLAELEGAFPENKHDAALAYLTSEHFVRYLASSFGPAVLPRIVAQAVVQDSFDEAFARVCGRPVEMAELEWRQSLRAANPPAWVVLRHLNLFALMALLLIAAFVAMKRRSKRIKEAWDREGWGE